MKKTSEMNNDRADFQERMIDVSCEEIFSAINTPEKLARWWGPKGFTSTVHECQFIEGGVLNLTMHGPDGKDYPNEYRFIEIKPNKKIVIEHLAEPHHFILTIELTAKNNSTVISWHQQFDTVEHYQEIADFVAVANQQNLERLESVMKE